jgi:predicted nuclease of predicted toxin-antitoxin system
MKLLVDMNLSPSWIALLRRSGWEALHWSAVGRAGAGDAEIMAYASTNGYVVVTHDLDFGAILAVTHGKKPSVVQIRTEDVSPAANGSHVVAAIRHVESELEAGALLTVEADRTRLRILPLRAAE